jgi:hypothetical protein
MSRSTQNQSPVITAEVNETQGKKLATAFWNFAKHYKLTRAQQAFLLGMKPTARVRGLEDRKEIPLEADKFARVGMLMGIHKNLRVLYPENREVVYSWLRTKRPEFEGNSAIEWMMKDEVNSFARLFTVRRMLDEMRVK